MKTATAPDQTETATVVKLTLANWFLAKANELVDLVKQTTASCDAIVTDALADLKPLMQNPSAFYARWCDALTALSAHVPVKLDGENGRPKFSEDKATRKAQMKGFAELREIARKAQSPLYELAAQAGFKPDRASPRASLSPSGILTATVTERIKIKPKQARGAWVRV